MERLGPFGLGRRVNLFQTIRLLTYAALVLSSIVVVGIAGHFAVIFLPQLHFNMVVFSLVVPSVTMVVLFIVMLRSQPRIDIFAVFILGVMWLSLAAYQTDFIGHVECFALGNQRTNTKNGGSTSAREYCYELKVIQAFSWANFAILALTFVILLILILRVLAHGRQDIWRESISNLPWFGQYGGGGMAFQPYGYAYGQQPYYPAMPYGAYGGAYNGYPNTVYQQPGHTTIIQQQPSGMPMVTQVPTVAAPHSIVPPTFDA